MSKGGYKTKSSKGPGGTVNYITQYPNGKPKTSTSRSMGSSVRVAVTRNGNGSVVQRTTQKLSDGYTKRTTKTIVPKYKPPKIPKQPKMPKLKTSVLKEPKPVKFKPYKAPKQKPFKWPKSTRSKRSSPKNSGPSASTFLTKIIVFTAFLVVFAVLFG